MKFTLTAFLAASALATPVPAPDVEAYRLRVQSSEKSLNGQALSIYNGQVGIFRTVSAPALEVYVAPAARSDLIVLHTYPAGSSDNVLAIVGENGLFNLTTLEDPNARGLRPNGTVDWGFSMSRRAPPASESGKPDTSNLLLYTGKTGNWIAWPVNGEKDYVIKFRGNEGYLAHIDMPAKIVYGRIED